MKCKLPNSIDSRRWTLAVLALALAGLACSRASVDGPPQGSGMGGGALPVTSAETSLAAMAPALDPTPDPATDIDSAAQVATSLPVETASPTPAEPEPVLSPTYPPTPTSSLENTSERILYTSQPGDMLKAVAVRFGVLPDEIEFQSGVLPGEQDLIAAGRLMIIPRRLGATGPSARLIPDSELVFSPHATDFDVLAFVEAQGGYLREHREYIGGRWRSGSELVARVARDNSVNPRILLAILEYYSGWVTDPSEPDPEQLAKPLGDIDLSHLGLFRQLTWLANELGLGYYDWRAGKLTELELQDGSLLRLAPDLNAGTVALQTYFARRSAARDWARAISGDGFVVVYRDLFGDPFAYTHPLYEPGVRQPELILPFLPGHVWSFSGGPHGAWERESAWAALDFAPPSMTSGCVTSDDWVVASAAGQVVRSADGVVMLDLDGDGREQTGWVILYLHIAAKNRIEVGTFVEVGDLLGHPSCEGGIATGTHVHMARKYNGEWIVADGPIPFELSGWVALAGSEPYQGALVKGDETVLACPCGSRPTMISR